MDAGYRLPDREGRTAATTQRSRPPGRAHQVPDVSAIPAKVRAAVHERAQGRCEGCGRIAPLELHHRKYRSRGGTHTVENLVALCGWGITRDATA
ncbi:HNH endonuclease [Microbacterium maritypicum]|uniref:HNH endonuclease n=1 Tax=Microbacterium maritypicum TaxID=33918 RepID=UPI0037FEC5A1